MGSPIHADSQMAYDGSSLGVGGRLRPAARFARPGADRVADRAGGPGRHYLRRRGVGCCPDPTPERQSGLGRGEGSAEAAHRAELAASQVEVARAAAQSRKSQAEVAELGGQRDKVLRQAAEAQVDTLQQQLASLQAKQTERGIVLTVGDVLFDVGQATLKPGAVNEIVRLAQFLEENPERKVRIEGHTDSTGSITTNLVLSQRRAEVGGGYARGRRGRA